MDTPTGTRTPQEVSIGQFVNYVLDQGPNAGQVRPAIVVNKFDNTTGGKATDSSPPRVNLQVFIDGMNDGLDTAEGGLLWKTSTHYSPDKEAGTWHFMAPATTGYTGQGTAVKDLVTNGYDRSRSPEGGRTGLV